MYICDTYVIFFSFVVEKGTQPSRKWVGVTYMSMWHLISIHTYFRITFACTDIHAQDSSETDKVKAIYITCIVSFVRL